jgi:hypothetical protein
MEGVGLSRESVIRRRRNLLRVHPYCHWCEIELVWYYIPGGHNNADHGKLPDNFATIEHIYTKNDGPRPTKGKLVLACLKCNHDRGQADEAIRRIRRDLSADIPDDGDHLTHKIGDSM